MKKVLTMGYWLLLLAYQLMRKQLLNLILPKNLNITLRSNLIAMVES